MIIDFQSIKDRQETAIAIERTGEFYSIARKLGDFIAALPIGREENDRLIALIIQQVQAGEQGAFNQGFRMGYDFNKWKTEHPEE